MSGHRRVKDISYEDDDFGDYYDDEDEDYGQEGAFRFLEMRESCDR